MQFFSLFYADWRGNRGIRKALKAIHTSIRITNGSSFENIVAMQIADMRDFFFLFFFYLAEFDAVITASHSYICPSRSYQPEALFLQEVDLLYQTIHKGIKRDSSLCSARLRKKKKYRIYNCIPRN